MIGRKHPLGYKKIHLFTRRIKLHIWKGNGSDNPHDHRWSFVSIPLWGRFKDTRWEAVPGNDYEAVLVRVREHVSNATVTRAHLTPTAVYIRRPFVPYRSRIGEIHSYEAVGGGAHVSLVLTGRSRTPVSTMWRKV